MVFHVDVGDRKGQRDDLPTMVMDDCLSEPSATFQLREAVTNESESEMKNPSSYKGQIHKSREGIEIYCEQKRKRHALFN
jgi:hypothetical protein